MSTPTLAELQAINTKVTTRTTSWLDLAMRAWGGEFKAPDHGIYEFSNGRRFDSTDKGQTGIYNPYALAGLELEQASQRYPDAVAFLLTEDGKQLDLG